MINFYYKFNEVLYVINFKKCLFDISGFEMFYGVSIAYDFAFVFVCDNKKYTRSRMLGSELLVKACKCINNIFL